MMMKTITLHMMRQASGQNQRTGLLQFRFHTLYQSVDHGGSRHDRSHTHRFFRVRTNHRGGGTQLNRGELRTTGAERLQARLQSRRNCTTAQHALGIHDRHGGGGSHIHSNKRKRHAVRSPGRIYDPVNAQLFRNAHTQAKTGVTFGGNTNRPQTADLIHCLTNRGDQLWHHTGERRAGKGSDILRRYHLPQTRGIRSGVQMRCGVQFAGKPFGKAIFGRHHTAKADRGVSNVDR